MVATYTIFGRQVGSHVLSMLTLGTVFAGSAYAMSGGDKEKAKNPPINATSKEEEEFINEFLKNAEAEEQKDKDKAKH